MSTEPSNPLLDEGEVLVGMYDSTRCSAQTNQAAIEIRVAEFISPGSYRDVPPV